MPPHALACRECGADAETGWSEETYLDGIDLPGDETYDELLERELGVRKGPPPPHRRPFWKGLIWVLVLILAFPAVIVILWIVGSLLGLEPSSSD